MPLPESCCCFSLSESSGCDEVQNLCSAISEMHSASHLFMHGGSHQKLLDLLDEWEFRVCLWPQTEKKCFNKCKSSQKKKSVYLKVGLQLFPIAFRPLFHGSFLFVCKNRVNASENLHVPQVSLIFIICFSTALSLPCMFFLNVDECNAFSILFILFVNLAL